MDAVAQALKVPLPLPRLAEAGAMDYLAKASADDEVATHVVCECRSRGATGGRATPDPREDGSDGVRSLTEGHSLHLVVRGVLHQLSRDTLVRARHLCGGACDRRCIRASLGIHSRRSIRWSRRSRCWHWWHYRRHRVLRV